MASGSLPAHRFGDTPDIPPLIPAPCAPAQIQHIGASRLRKLTKMVRYPIIPKRGSGNQGGGLDWIWAAIDLKLVKEKNGSLSICEGSYFLPARAKGVGKQGQGSWQASGDESLKMVRITADSGRPQGQKALFVSYIRRIMSGEGYATGRPGDNCFPICIQLPRSHGKRIPGQFRGANLRK
ncbi:hypothetical protein R3P38DRAFT_2768662 [Favolaschia claudopus]|uniref:Uncharacterized protein n=1 Tax=Favolaschia claudopus TaxID=2862362 RepID=A0AAW0CNM4_9AGAR